MTLAEILRDSNYKLNQFNLEEIQTLGRKTIEGNEAVAWAFIDEGTKEIVPECGNVKKIVDNF